MGNQFNLIEMIKYLYNSHPLLLGFFSFVILISMFTMLIIFYEFNNDISFIDSLWYVLITVLTIGFGELSATTFLG